MSVHISAARVSLYCDKEDYEFYRSLSGQGDAYNRPFATSFDAFISFACIGYHYDSFIPLGPASEKEELTLASYLNEDKRLWTLAALAYAHLKQTKPDADELEIARGLLSTTTIIPVVEGWANGGTKIIRSLYSSGEIVDNRTLGLAEMLMGDLGA